MFYADTITVTGFNVSRIDCGHIKPVPVFQADNLLYSLELRFDIGAASEWFKKDCIGSVTTWEDLVEKFVQKFYHLSNKNEEMEAEERIRTYEEYKLNNTVTRDLEEPWLDNGVPYQLCDHIREPYDFNNRMTKCPTCSSDIDGFCNGGELPRMVRVECMTYF
ncbi:hypothetical protein Tco_0507455 [Tanacetum coccineum]